MSDASSGQDTQMRIDAGRREGDAPGAGDAVAIRRLRGATEYRGRREALLATGDVHEEWLPPERPPGHRMRATLRARDGGRRWGCLLCRLLDALDPGHCDKSRGT